MFKKRFLTKERLLNHIEKCKNNESSIEKQLPEEGKNILFLKNTNNKFMNPLYIAPDFEGTLTPVNIVNGEISNYRKHKPNSYGLKFSCICEKFFKTH